ncbi:hypothetical protein JMJ35_009270 [Cladonia borealis]|uniref:Uncharacterized protein n=1 Tax=Cladonia borealis TaxID=184061 RepID=A0AA39QTL6_9LECA|nr:hypothetical protein JMJ35_009270 [Cladonia borealis]
MRRKRGSKAGDLEVDAYDAGLQFAYDKDDLPEALYPTPVENRARQKVSELPGHDVIIKKQEGTLFRLSIALGLSVIFAIVAAAIATTMAMRLHTVKSQFGNGTCPTTDQTCKTNTSTMVPTSDCYNITATYNAVISDASYDLFCNANQPNGDIMSVWVYTFEDCIRACSSYDTMGDKSAAYCYGVSYTYTMHQNPAVVANSGNCWLKYVKHNASVMFAEVGVDSAFIYGLHE